VNHTGYFLQGKHVFGPAGYTRHVIQDERILGPGSKGGYFVSNGHIFGPSGYTGCWLQESHIFGDASNLPFHR